MLVALGVLVIATPVGTAISQLGDDSTVPAPAAPAPEPGGGGLPEPQLTAAQESEAQQLVANDAATQAILNGEAYTVTNIGPWGGDDGGPVTGAALGLELNAPGTFAMQEWPRVAFRPGQHPPYQAMRVHMAASDVRELFVLVDLDSDRVVHVEPDNGRAQITPGADFKRKLVEPGSNPDD